MRKACLFALGVLLAASAMAQPPIQSIRELTPANAEAFRSWAQSASQQEKLAFRQELRNIPRPQRQKALRILFPELRTRQIARTASPSSLGGGPFSIQYDSFPTSFTFLGQRVNVFVGNQFDTGLPSGTNTINSVQFLPLAFGQVPQSAQLGFFGPLVGSAAPPLGTRNGGIIPPGPGTLQTAVLASPITGLTGSFQAGMFQPQLSPIQGIAAAYIGITGYGYQQPPPTGGALGPGDSLHLMTVTSGGNHSAIADSTFRNAIFRVSGVTIPVELTNFSVD